MIRTNNGKHVAFFFSLTKFNVFFNDKFTYFFKFLKSNIKKLFKDKHRYQDKAITFLYFSISHCFIYVLLIFCIKILKYTLHDL